MQPPTRNSVRRLLGSTAVACAIAAGIATPAAATPPTYPPAGPTSTTVLGTTITRTPTAPSSSQLPFTGNPIAAYTLSGAALVLAGGLLSLSVRRRRTRRVTTS